VHRPAGARGGSAAHDLVTEVYHVLEGAGTLVTGGRMLGAQRREAGAGVVVEINGPGYSGSAIEGGVSRRIERGDVVIIPAGTPHWWTEVEEALTYTVVRVDPQQVVKLR
jgi:mannose-6-phosphate isomerase-like protein (cupin superfamily)